MGTQVHEHQSATTVHPLERVARFLLVALNFTACIVLAYLMWNRAPAWRAFALAAAVVPIYILSNIAWKIGDIFRKFVAPDMYFTSGVQDSFNKKVFWTVGPQATTSFWTIMISWVVAIYMLNPKPVETTSPEQVAITQMPQTSEPRTALVGPTTPSPSTAETPSNQTTGSTQESIDKPQLAPTTIADAPKSEPNPESNPTTRSRVTPSFDCAEAKSTQETLICESETLAELDKVLAAEYRDRLKTSSIPEQLRRGQIQWLKNNRGNCFDAECLATSYRARIAELQALNK